MGLNRVLWQIPLARPTMDIDMLGRTTVTPEALVAILRDGMTLSVEDDGMRYDPIGYSAERWRMVESLAATHGPRQNPDGRSLFLRCSQTMLYLAYPAVFE